MGLDGKRGGAKRGKGKKISAVFTEKGKRGNIRCGANRSQEGLRQSKGGIWGTSTPNTKKKAPQGPVWGFCCGDRNRTYYLVVMRS